MGRVRAHRQRRVSPRGSSSCCCASWLDERIGKVAIPARLGLGALAVSAIAGGGAFGAWRLATRLDVDDVVAACIAIVVFGAIYMAVMIAARVPEAAAFVRRATRRRRGA